MNASSYDIDKIYEGCGIITSHLIDPLSQFISKIMGLNEDDPNSIGFYYEAELHGIIKSTVLLFNIYDNDPIPWLRLGYTMDLLLSSPFVTRITFYPLVTNSSDSSSSLLSRATMSTTQNSHSKKLEELFRTAVVETISINAKAIHDKNISYTSLLFKVVGITGEDADRLTNNLITGYSLVNKVLLTLMGIKHTDLNKISSSIIPCPLLKRPISIISPHENSVSSESDIKYVVEESRREITKLVAVFIDLFTTHDLFRSNILTIRSINTDKNSNRLINLDNLFIHENELVSHIVGGLQNGIISNVTLNEIIRNLNNERFTLGNYQSLPISTNPNKNVKILSEPAMCTFQQSSSHINPDPLRDLGIYINHIIDSFENPESLIINLGTLIVAYNNAIAGTNLPKITIPHSELSSGGTVSRQVILTLPRDSNSLEINPELISGHIINNEKETLSIPMYNANLTLLSESQLIDILVYIDSLRDSDGTGDTRFANLQNEITHEIASRRKIKKFSKLTK